MTRRYTPEEHAEAAAIRRRERNRVRMMRRRAKGTPERDRPPVRHFYAGGLAPSPETIEEAARAIAAGPRNITAALCGDPLPGRSALDRRSRP